MHDTTKKIPTSIWQSLLKATIPSATYIGALDSTGFSRTNPSYHYLRRINGAIPRVPVKLSALIDTKNKKFIDAVIRVLPAHDIRDAKKIIKRNKMKKMVADKAYDAEWLHELCIDNGIKAIIPIRKWGKPRVGITRLRYTSNNTFQTRTYHRRSIIESLFHAIKTTFGGYTNNKKSTTIKAEMYLRLLTYNLFLFTGLFRTDPFFKS